MQGNAEANAPSRVGLIISCGSWNLRDDLERCCRDLTWPDGPCGSLLLFTQIQWVQCHTVGPVELTEPVDLRAQVCKTPGPEAVPEAVSRSKPCEWICPFVFHCLPIKHLLKNI